MSALADRPRRRTLAALMDREPPVPLRELAVAVDEAGPGADHPVGSATDGGTSPSEARRSDGRDGSEPARSVAIELYHVHLPKLEAAGFLSFDPESREVTDWSIEEPSGTSR